VARVLLLLVIGFFLWLLFRGFFRSQLKDREGGGEGAAGKPEDMVACALCGVNMPRSEARQDGERYTCADPSSCKQPK
jgi:hypothetical protein